MARQEHNSTGDNFETTINSNTDHLAQTFTPAVSHTVRFVRVYVRRWQPTGTVTAEIRTVDGDGKPTVTVLCSGTVNGNTWSTADNAWIKIDLGAGVALTAGTKYALVLGCDSNIPDAAIWRISTGDLYAGGNAVVGTDEIGWTLLSMDFLFEEWTVTPSTQCVVVG